MSGTFVYLLIGEWCLEFLYYSVSLGYYVDERCFSDNANSRNVTGEADGSADVRTTIIVISMVCTVTFVAGTAGVAVIVWLHRRSRRSKET